MKSPVADGSHCGKLHQIMLSFHYNMYIINHSVRQRIIGKFLYQLKHAVKLRIAIHADALRKHPQTVILSKITRQIL